MYHKRLREADCTFPCRPGETFIANQLHLPLKVAENLTGDTIWSGSIVDLLTTEESPVGAMRHPATERENENFLYICDGRLTTIASWSHGRTAVTSGNPPTYTGAHLA